MTSYTHIVDIVSLIIAVFSFTGSVTLFFAICAVRRREKLQKLYTVASFTHFSDQNLRDSAVRVDNTNLLVKPRPPSELYSEHSIPIIPPSTSATSGRGIVLTTHVFYMSLCDIFLSVWCIITFSASIADYEWGSNPDGTHFKSSFDNAICHILALFAQFGAIGSAMWYIMINACVWRILMGFNPFGSNSKLVVCRHHFIVWSITLICCFLPLVFNEMGVDTQFVEGAPRDQQCWLIDKKWTLSLYGIIALAIANGICLLLWVAIRYYYFKLWSDTPNQAYTQRVQRLMKRFRFFVGFYIVAWIIPAVRRYYTLFTDSKQTPDWLVLGNQIGVASTGFANAIVWSTNESFRRWLFRRENPRRMSSIENENMRQRNSLYAEFDNTKPTNHSIPIAIDDNIGTKRESFVFDRNADYYRLSTSVAANDDNNVAEMLQSYRQTSGDQSADYNDSLSAFASLGGAHSNGNSALALNPQSNSKASLIFQSLGNSTAAMHEFGNDLMSAPIAENSRLEDNSSELLDGNSPIIIANLRGVLDDTVFSQISDSEQFSSLLDIRDPTSAASSAIGIGANDIDPRLLAPASAAMLSRPNHALLAYQMSPPIDTGVESYGSTSTSKDS